MRNQVIRVISFVVLINLVGCSTLVTIETEPSDAKVYINGDLIGNSPIQTDLSNFIGDSYYLKIEKNGYRTITRELEREIKPVELVLGILFTWIPILWCYGPKPYYNFILNQKDDISYLSNNRKDITVIVDGVELSNGMNIVKSGEHKIAISRNGITYNEIDISLISNYEYVVN